MAYKDSSLWDDRNEIRCLIILKRLLEEGFPRGRQMELCREMSELTGLEPGNISAKIGNFKSIAGINKASNASVNARRVFERCGNLSIEELEALVR